MLYIVQTQFHKLMEDGRKQTEAINTSSCMNCSSCKNPGRENHEQASKDKIDDNESEQLIIIFTFTCWKKLGVFLEETGELCSATEEHEVNILKRKHPKQQICVGHTYNFICLQCLDFFIFKYKWIKVSFEGVAIFMSNQCKMFTMSLEIHKVELFFWYLRLIRSTIFLKMLINAMYSRSYISNFNRFKRT